MNPPENLPISIRRYLLAFILRRRAILALRSIATGMAAALAWTLLICVVDRLFQLPQPARWAGLGAMLLFLFAGIGAALWQSIRHIDWNLAAERIEGRTRIFDERLRTIASQFVAGVPIRTSASMLSQTGRQVEQLLPSAPVHTLLPWRLVFGPWIAAALAGVVIFLACQIPSWEFDRLLARAWFPQRPVEAVTMTHMEISPRSVRVSQGETLIVSANVLGAPAAAAAQSRGVDLYLSADAKTWSRASMNATELGSTESRFEFAIPSIDRDLLYYIRAGDARSETYSIQVRRVPAVTEFKIRYDYPDYTNHAPTIVTNTDGSIECLVRSTATVTLTATEPLASATWVLGRDRLPMTRLATADQWQVSFPVTQSSNSAVEMLSAAGVLGRGPSPMPVRPLPDEAPRGAVLQPALDVRLEPADSLVVRFAAVDDYGLGSMSCQIRVNGQIAARAVVAVPTKPLHREGEFLLDLAKLNVSIGDVVSLQVEAQDEWGQSSLSDARNILIAPVSAPLRSYERAMELRRAARLARAWNEALTKARKALDSARAGDPKSNRQEPWLAAGRALSSAMDAAASLRQSLLRAEARADSTPLADALAVWIDATQVLLIEPGRPLTSAARTDEALFNRLNAAINRNHDLSAQLDIVQQGERSAFALLESRNLKVLAALPRLEAEEPTVAEAMSLRKKAIDDLRQSLNDQIREMSLNDQMTDLDPQLQYRIDRARDVLKTAHPPDLLAAAQEWAGRTGKISAMLPGEFPARLESAAVVQGIRSDGSLSLARDLQLASRAALVMAQTPRETERPHPAKEKAAPRPRPPASAPVMQQFPAVLAQILNGKDLDAARARLTAWIGHAPPDPADAAAAWAFEASAQQSQGAYDAAAQADAKLAEEILHWSPEQSSRFAAGSARTLGELREIEALQKEQLAVRQLTEQADPEDTVGERQDQLAQAIAALRSPGEGLAAVALPSAVEANVVSERPIEMPTLPEPSPELATRRPLLGATWHAQAAVNALDNLLAESDAVAVAELWERALREQSQVVTYLQLAARQANHRESLRRLLEAPALAPIFQPTSAEGPLAAGFDRLGGKAQDWLRGLATEKPSSPDTPAGKVQDQLQAYFESLSKAQKAQK